MASKRVSVFHLSFSHVYFYTGRLVDTYKNYELIFYMVGGELMAAGVFLAIASYCCIKPQKNKETAAIQEADIEGNSNHTDHEANQAMNNN